MISLLSPGVKISTRERLAMSLNCSNEAGAFPLAMSARFHGRCPASFARIFATEDTGMVSSGHSSWTYSSGLQSAFPRFLRSVILKRLPSVSLILRSRNAMICLLCDAVTMWHQVPYCGDPVAHGSLCLVTWLPFQPSWLPSWPFLRPWLPCGTRGPALPGHRHHHGASLRLPGLP